MLIRIPVRGYFEVNCYFCIDDESGHGFIIDPGAQANELLNVIEKHHWTIEKILLTHGHFDHLGAVDTLSRTLHVPVLAHEKSETYLLDPAMNLSYYYGQPITVSGTQKVVSGDRISLQVNPAFFLTVLHTPGHTEDSVTYYLQSEHAAFVGDTIFKGSFGTSQFPGGDPVLLRQSIFDVIFTLPNETVLLSGHTDETSVSAEKNVHLSQ